jgi:FAD synthase
MDIEVFLVKKLREERQFSSLDELKDQIMSDRNSALEILKGVKENGF